MTLSTLTYPAFLRNRRRTSSRPPAGKYNKKIGRLVDGYPLHSTFLKASDCKAKCEKNEEQENHFSHKSEDFRFWTECIDELRRDLCYLIFVNNRPQQIFV